MRKVAKVRDEVRSIVRTQVFDFHTCISLNSVDKVFTRFESYC